jgi:cardiolipin synthase
MNDAAGDGDSMTSAVPSGIPVPTTPSQGRAKRWLRRLLFTLLSVVLALYLIVWRVALRIVEHPSWPPPADAMTPDQAQSVTEAFARKGDRDRQDVAIAYAPTTASDVRLFLDGPQFFPAMLDDIATARDSIHMQMFGITPGEIADQFVDALVEQANARVEVRVSVDYYGAKVSTQSKPYFDALRNAGVEVVVNNEWPMDRDGLYGEQAVDWLSDEVGKADHRKMLVIDGRVGWVGGAGLQDHFNASTFRDVFVRVEGTIVRQMQAVFLTSFVALGGPLDGEPGALAAYFPAPRDPGTIRTTLLQNIPNGFLPGTQASREIIEQATTRLDILNPYFTDPGIVDRVVAAAERGVRVRLLVSAQSNNEPADAALKHEYGRLLKAGVEIWEYPVTMHAKVTIADDAMIVGTINYDAWALYRNLEIALLFEDATAADMGVTQFVVPNIANSTPGEVPTGRRERVENWIWDKLTYFL